jgi:hypothetical protein
MSEWLQWPAPANIVAGESHHVRALEGLTGKPREAGYCKPVVVVLEREPHNKYDDNAVVALVDGHAVGYLRRTIAAIVGPQMDSAGLRMLTVAGALRGGWSDAPNVGCHVWLDRSIGPTIAFAPDMCTEWVAAWPPDWEEFDF